MKLKDLHETMTKTEDQVEHHKEISELKFLEMLKDHSRNSYSVIRKSPIYITDRDFKADFYVCSPETREVKTAFWIDRLVNEHHSWNRYPSRSKFLRGFTSLDRAGNVEDVYVLIPYDMTRIGICSEASFYRSFKAAQSDLDISRLDNDGLSSWITRVASGINDLYPEAKINTKEPDSLVQFLKLVGKVDEVIKEKKEFLKKKLREDEKIKDDVRKVLNDVIGRHVTSVESYLTEKLDPEMNGFSAPRVESWTRPSEPREVWIDRPCLLVKREKYIEMHKRGAVK